MSRSRKIVADSGPLIGFGRIGRLELLIETCGEVLLAPAVVEECCRDRSLPGARAIERALSNGTLRRHELGRAEPLDGPPGLGAGELESMAVALDLGLVLLVDDRVARMYALSRGVQVVGSGAILLLALKDGRLREIRPVLDELTASGYRLGSGLRAELLRRAGER